MGIYNPRAPQILGEEWVDIRNEDIVFSPSVDVVELGHTFTPTASRTLTEGRFYVKEYPPTSVAHQVVQVSVYKTGTEDITGPVRSVLIPCNAAEITGTGFNPTTSADIVNSLLTPGDGNYVQIQPFFSLTSKRMLLYFATSNPGYAALLAGKRILKVELVQSISWDPIQSGTTNSSGIPPVFDGIDQGFGILTSGVPFSTAALFPYAGFVVYNGSAIVSMKGGIPIGLPSQALPQTVIDFGSIDVAWNTPPYVNTNTKLPWRYEELLRFEQTAGTNRLSVYYEWGGSNNWSGAFYLAYAALKVTFCEENRVAYGAASFGGSAGFTSDEPPYNLGANVVTMYTPSFATSPVLQAGQQYTAVLSSPDIGDWIGPFTSTITQPAQANTYPKLNGLRAMEASPAHAGVKVNVTQTEGETFTQESTLVLPQLTLHTSSGPLTEMHVYGQQARGQVFGVQAVTQEVLDSATGGPAAFPQVRFFARRFGNTTVPLTLTGSQPGGLFVPGKSGSYASTPDNAALDVTGDIDLRVDLTAVNWTLGTEQTLLSKWTNTGPQFSYLFSIAAGTGNLVLGWSATGAAALFAVSTVPPVPGPNGRLAVRVTLDVDNGAAGRTVTFYTAPTINDTFVQLGAPVTTAGVTSIFNSTAPVEIGSQTGGTTNLLNGVVYSAEIRNLIGGTLVASPFFAGQAPGTTSFTDAQGRVWTVNGTAAIIGGTLGNTVSITPAQFDALDEVLDGWKQVDLRFASTPTMGAGTNPQWKWTAAGELPGNRWEVLGATAPAISGVNPASPFQVAPGPQQLSTATYGQPSAGSTINMGWMPQYAPPVSGSADDQTSDAVLLFSQDQPTVSGFIVSAASQTLTGIGLNCNTYPWYVPSSISYNQLSWSQPSGLILDTFSTPAVSGWSPADTGQTFANAGAAPVASYSVSGGTGKIAIGILNTGYAQEVNLGTPNQDLTIFVTPPALVTGVGAATIVDLRIRRTNDSNNYSGRLTFNTGGVINGTLFKTVAGVGATLGTAPDLTHVDGHTYGLRVSAIGSLIQLKTWDATLGSEPTTWLVSATNAELATGNLFSVFAFASSAVTNTLPYTFQFDNLTSDVSTFGYYEIQRMDTLTDWQDIAQIASPFVSGFRDYEARVGLLSSYRIRGVNTGLFAGPWSSTATLTMTAPGLTGTGMTGTPYVLIFTSNARQDGSRSLAYALAYDGAPTEPFSFPEAGFTQYQFMYNRDFQVAFRPLERGGEAFSRTVLVQAAAISPETLADFKSLRDMAWDTLPYVCVRDQDGNRWFANVTVPSGRVQHKRQLYLADINVTEVTETSAVTVV